MSDTGTRYQAALQAEYSAWDALRTHALDTRLHLTTPIGVYSGPVMHMWTDLDTGEGRWVTKLCWNIEVAALEEMRVRAAVVRAIQVPHCLHCGGLLARPCGCETPGCRPGMAQTSICRSCAGPVPDGLYPCPACQYAPWQEGAIVVVNGVPSWKET